LIIVCEVDSSFSGFEYIVFKFKAHQLIYLADLKGTVESVQTKLVFIYKW